MGMIKNISHILRLPAVVAAYLITLPAQAGILDDVIGTARSVVHTGAGVVTNTTHVAGHVVNHTVNTVGHVATGSSSTRTSRPVVQRTIYRTEYVPVNTQYQQMPAGTTGNPPAHLILNNR